MRTGKASLRQIVVAALVAFVTVVVAVFAAAPALAVTQSPHWTVTAYSGPTNLAPATTNTVQSVTVNAGGGTFTLTFKGQTTSPIPAKASAGEVQSALDALSTIGGVGGSVSVAGGPGGAAGAHPFVVTFEASLRGINVEPMTLGEASLTFGVGDTLDCTGGPTEFRGEPTTSSYQWLRNGQPISGATSSTYVAVAADEGTAIQCLSSVSSRAGRPASVGASATRVIGPPPAAAPPVPPSSIPAPSGFAHEGETLTCEPESWGGSPTFTYRWLKSGTPIPGATSSTYPMGATDAPSNMQCEVIGTNAGGSVAQISANKETSPEVPGPEEPPQATATVPVAVAAITTEGGSRGIYAVLVKNTGGAPSDGSQITVTDVLPSGLIPAGSAFGSEELLGNALSCTGLVCTYTGTVVPGDSLSLTIPVEVAPDASSTVTNTVTVSGGGALEAIAATPTAISSTPAPFGIAPGSVATALSTTQAGAHPDLTVSLAFNTVSNGLLAGDPKETVADLPPGFVGDLADTPRCPIASFSKAALLFSAQGCSLGTQVGTTTLTVNLFGHAGEAIVPVYNLTPNPGEIAKLGFDAVEFGVQGTVSLRPGDYGVRTTFQNINQNQAQLDKVSLTVWGVPSDPSHDAMRGLICNGAGICSYANTKTAFGGSPSELPGGQSSTSPPIPYLTSPTECTVVPLVAKLKVRSWEHGEDEKESDVGPLIGCNLLPFGPWIETAAPDTSRADSPAGFTFDLKVPQEGLVTALGISTADIKNTSVTLPAGVVINPGQAAGLGACQLSQQEVEASEGPPSCPSNSKVGHVEIETPLIKHKLEGEVYLLQSNPPDVKLLVAPEDPPDGIYVKFVGDVHLNEATGQLITTFEKTPQLPFSDLKLSFSGGAQAALATPTACGTFATMSDFTPWSAPATPDVHPTDSFAITSGPGGSACASPLPFSPSLIAGTTTDQAGGFTNFSLLLQRADGQQRIERLQFKVPPGLSGMISQVPLCGEPQAVQGTCSAASQIGHAVVASGPGPYPLVVPQPGQSPAPIYLTGPYKGAPFGLSIVVPVIAGPFNLGNVITRASIAVDPYTAQITVTTDPLPQIIKGVPTDLRTINSVIDRPGFMFNPTNCSPLSFSGTAFSAQGATAPISSHFQVGSCQSLKFKPDFKVSTSGKTSRANGASLEAKIVYPTGPLVANQASSQANVASVKVDLPKQLPSRLTTLQKACTAAQFASNPAGCPVASVVGHVKVITPLLPVPLTGPAIFVSHGGEAFPSLIMVLQGYGVTVDLVGSTFISKAGITSSTFKSTPDVPFSSFDLQLPQGKYSALAANGNLCKSKLVMPTAFTAQNGAEIHESTKVAVSGCRKAVRHVRKKNHRKKKQ